VTWAGLSGRQKMKIPDYLLNKFDKESEAIEYGNITIKAIFQDGKPVFIFDKNTSEKYIPDRKSLSTRNYRQ
jgi:hypothetical protein